MAKAKKTKLPTVVEDVIAVDTECQEQPVTPVEEPASSEMPVVIAKVELPLAKLRHGYEPRRCDVTSLSGEQRVTLRKLTNGLIAKKAKLANGRIVVKPQDAIKWLLEQV